MRLYRKGPRLARGKCGLFADFLLKTAERAVRRRLSACGRPAGGMRAQAERWRRPGGAGRRRVAPEVRRGVPEVRRPGKRACGGPCSLSDGVFFLGGEGESRASWRHEWRLRPVRLRGAFQPRLSRKKRRAAKVRGRGDGIKHRLAGENAFQADVHGPPVRRKSLQAVRFRTAAVRRGRALLRRRNALVRLRRGQSGKSWSW